MKKLCAVAIMLWAVGIACAQTGKRYDFIPLYFKFTNVGQVVTSSYGGPVYGRFDSVTGAARYGTNVAVTVRSRAGLHPWITNGLYRHGIVLTDSGNASSAGPNQYMINDYIFAIATNSTMFATNEAILYVVIER